MARSIRLMDQRYDIAPAPALALLAFLALPVAGGPALAQDELAELTEKAEEQLEEAAERTLPDDGLSEIVLDVDEEFVEDEAYLEGVDEDILDRVEESPEERLSRLFTLYLDAVANKSFDEADALAKQVVELTISEYGLDSDQSAKALTNLAIAQHGSSDYDAAILNYEAAVGIIERIDDRLSQELINPLRGLGAAQLATGRPDLARDSFDRAVHISHVNDGPHNMEQIETLESLAETYLSVGEFEDAVDVQKRIYYLQARNVDTKSLDILPALRTRAAFQRRMQLYDQERFTWRRVISIIEDNNGKDSIDLIEPLTKLGNSYLYVGFSDAPYAQTASVSSGEIYLKRAVRVAEANPDAGWTVLTDAMLELGNYYMLSARPNRAERVYSEVWEILSDGSNPERLAARERKLGQIEILQDIQPPLLYGEDLGAPIVGRPPGYESGSVIYEYVVSTRGRPTDIRVIEADPEGLEDMYQSVARDVRRLMYRPRFENGEMIETGNVTYRHEFYYREVDLPEQAAARSDDADRQ